MRRRITRALATAAAASATITTMGLAAAGSAGAATTGHTHTFAPSAPVITTAPCSGVDEFTSNAPLTFPFGGGGCAGYVGSGRNFRYAQAIIRIPQTNVIPLTTAVGGNANGSALQAPSMYVGLTSGDAMAAAGLMTCPNVIAVFGVLGPCTGTISTTAQIWVGVGWTAVNNGATVTAQAFPLTGVLPGDGVEFQVYYPAGGAAHFNITTGPTSTSPVAHSFQLPSTGTLNAVFNHAVGLVDYSASRICTAAACVAGVTATGFPLLTPGPAPGSADLRITQFQMGAWTTVPGDRGTFVGPWTLNAADVTNNGTPPPGGTINVEPAYLWNDGLGGGFGDAFGAWWRA